MRNYKLIAFAALALLMAYFAAPILKTGLSRLFSSPAIIAEVQQKAGAELGKNLSERGLQIGSPAFIRVFKEERILEVWLKNDSAYELFNTYEICNYSGKLGPKLREGDRQSPEGFYEVPATAMNPNSSYHLSFNLGFPNAYDRAHHRTGSYLMIHGDCVSVGCYAMTDESIEDIYLIVEAAQRAGQANVPVHAFPFRMTAERMQQEHGSPWIGYWRNLKEGYDLFEQEMVPPTVSVLGKTYVFATGI